MADLRLTDKDLIVTIDVDNDLLHIVDVSDTTSSPEGTSRRVTPQQLIDLNPQLPSKLTNTEYINQLSDFPTPVANEIILEDGIVYKCSSVDISPNLFRVNPGDTVALISDSSSNAILTSDTTAGLITSTDGIVITSDISFDAPMGRIYDLDQNTGTCSLFATNVQHLGAVLPSRFEDLLTTSIFNCRFASHTNGVLSFFGSNLGEFRGSENSFGLSILGIIMDLGAAVFESYNFNDNRLITTTFNTFMSSSIGGSGNIAVGGIGRVLNTANAGSDPTLVGIDPSDIRWDFEGNKDITDSIVNFTTYITATELVTITTLGVFVPIAGVNWTTGPISNRWTVDTAGIATFNGEDEINMKFTIDAPLFRLGGGGAQDIAIRLNVDTGSGFPATPPIESQGQAASATGAVPVSSSVTYLIQPGDRVQLWIGNLGGTSDINVEEIAKVVGIEG